MKLPVVTFYAAIVGSVVRHARRARGITQADFSEKLGLAASTLCRIETGASAFTVEQLAEAARILALTPGSILSQADRAKTRGAEIEITIFLSRETCESVVEARKATMLSIAKLRSLVASFCCAWPKSETTESPAHGE